MFKPLSAASRFFRLLAARPQPIKKNGARPTLERLEDRLAPAGGLDFAEVNDTFGTAYHLGRAGSSTWTGLTIDAASDVDFFSFRLDSAGGPGDFARIDFTHSLGDIDLELYGAAGNLLTGSNGTADTETISLNGRAAATYFLKVYGASNDYSLGLEGPTAGGDFAEPNEDAGAAFALPSIVGGHTRPGLSIHSIDQDWFSFRLRDIGTASSLVSIDGVDGGGDLDLRVFAADGVTVVGSSTSSTPDETVSLEGRPAGLYYVQVFGFLGAINDYNLFVKGPTPAPADAAPVITSAAATTFLAGAAGAFTVTSTGSPAATLTVASTLPAGVTFTNNGNGTATLAGTPTAGGVSNIVITASNGVGSNATQNFTLTVNASPAITSANATTFALNAPGTFTVTTTGFPTPDLSATGLPAGVTFTDNGNGTATITGTPTVAGVFNLLITAFNGGSDATQAFTLTVTAFLATLTVDNAGDVDDRNFAAGQLTLREAIALNNVPGFGVTTITFASSLNGQTIILGGTQLPTVTDGVTIQGPGANLLTIDANNLSRILEVATGVTAAVSGLTFTRGKSGNGGAILNDGTLAVTNCTISSSSANSLGGGILNLEKLTVTNSTLSSNSAGDRGAGIASLGTLIVENSTLSENSADNLGGGISSLGTLTVTNSTLSGNKANNRGGGIINLGGSATVKNSTLVLNRADADGNGLGIGGGIDNDGTTKLLNTIVAGNLSGTGTSASDISGNNVNGNSVGNVIGDALSTGGLFNNADNVVGVNGGGVRALNTIVNVTLAFNGGPTPTHALVAGSPAINTGNNALALDANNIALATDQRGPGFVRISGGTVDRGAYERQGPSDIALTQGELRENSAGGTLVGALASTDLDAGDTFTYQLIDNAGGRFLIGGASLVVAPGAVLDFETTPTLNVTVRSTDSFGVSLDKTFAITLTNVNEAPVNTVPGKQKVKKNRAFAFNAARRITVTDPDAALGTLRVTLTVTLGKLQVTAAGLKTITGNKTKRIVMTGKLSALNALLTTLKFTPLANRTGNAKLTITTEDLGNTGLGGPMSDTDTVTLTIK